MDVVADPIVGASPYNGSKSLVMGKRGFSPYFKSKARAELLTHCSHPQLLTRALTLPESYEALAICCLVAVHGSGRPGTLANLVWIPLSLRTATLANLKLRLQFLEGKATLTPGADQWKNWSGDYEKVYVSKNQKKKQQQGQELCLVSLADLDGFYKAGKRAEAKGQKFENWITSAGKKTLLSWSASAASRGATSDQILDPVPPVAQPGDLPSVCVGDPFFAGVSQLKSSQGGAADYPPSQSHRGGPTPDLSGGASGSTGPAQSVLSMSVGDLIKMLKHSGLVESELGKYVNTSQ